MSSLYFAICWFKSTYWDFLLCSSLKYPGKKFLPDSSIFNILSDILLMQSFNPYPNGSDMHFKVSFSSSRLFLESLLSNEPVSWGFYSFGKYFFTYFLKSLYQVCDSCSIWVTDSILPEILISFCFWFLKIQVRFKRILFIFHKRNFCFLKVYHMWSVSGLSCRKFGSCHSHIDDGVCLCSHWNHLFLSSSFMCIYAMNWMIFFFYFFIFLLLFLMVL